MGASINQAIAEIVTQAELSTYFHCLWLGSQTQTNHAGRLNLAPQGPTCDQQTITATVTVSSWASIVKSFSKPPMIPPASGINTRGMHSISQLNIIVKATYSLSFKAWPVITVIALLN